MGWVAGLVVGLCLPALAQMTDAPAAQVWPDGETILGRQIAAMIEEPAVSRAHWGVAVTAMDGTPIYGLNQGQLFQPASNTKMYTTAAAMALLGSTKTFETKIVGRGTFKGEKTLDGDLYLVGKGDANLSGREVPYVAPPHGKAAEQPAPVVDPLRYLAQMADQVAATGLKKVTGDVVGDDSWFRHEPFATNWSIDDAVWGYGAPVSALTVNDNQIKLTVTPGKKAGDPATYVLDPAMPGYYTIDMSVTTGPAKSGNTVQIERAFGSKAVRMYGAIAVDEKPDVEELAIDDPAEYSAIVLKAMLEERGVKVEGVARAKHVLSMEARGFQTVAKEPLDVSSLTQNAGCVAGGAAERVLAVRESVPLGEDVVVTNKVSQNLHAELLLRQLSTLAMGADCEGSIVEGARVVRAFLTTKVGIDKDDFVFFDGSGLSGHDLVTPRATVKLLHFASGQKWFADWKKSLPVGGEDGSLAGRFPKAPLAGHVFAKTGTLGEARALSGYLDCASGKTVIFSIMVDNHTPGVERGYEGDGQDCGGDCRGELGVRFFERLPDLSCILF